MKERKRVVIKVGTKVLTSQSRLLDRERVRDIAFEIADVKDAGAEVVLVTSGAIGSGLGLLGLKRRPTALAALQAAAAIGQSHLMHLYGGYFKERGYLAGQVLLTQEDFNDRARYLNIKHTLSALLAHKAIPIINENDTVSTDEIRCGDNDRLSGLVSDLCRADILVILTDVDGLLDDTGTVIRTVDTITPALLSLGKKSACDLGTGGMATKLAAIKTVVDAGIECVIANGMKRGAIAAAVAGADVGTRFLGRGATLIARKRWIAFSSRPKGTIVVDAGAHEALAKRNKSLLSSGIVSVVGTFKKGDVVAVAVKDGKEFARGRVAYPSEEIRAVRGLKTGEFKRVLGYAGSGEIIHKDELVII